MLRVCPVDGSRSSFLVCDEPNKQVTVLDQSVCAHHSVTTPAAVSSPSPASSRRRPLAPKMFLFDSVFSQDTSLVRKPLDSFRTAGPHNNRGISYDVAV